MIASLLTSILGNELAKRYDMPKHHAASGGWVRARGCECTHDPVYIFLECR